MQQSFFVIAVTGWESHCLEKTRREVGGKFFYLNYL